METNTPQKSSKLTLCVMTLMALLVSASAFFVSGILYEWYETSAILAICLVTIILCTLSYFLVRYGFLHHSVKQNNIPMLAIITAALILLSFLIAYLIGTHILHEDILNGKYPFNEFSYDARSDYKGMRIGCILGSLIVFGGSSAAIIAYKQRISTKLLSIGAVISTIILFVLSLYIGFNVSFDKSWYYGNEKALNNNINQYYAQIKQLDSICTNYNLKVTRLYDELLISELRDFHKGDQEPLPENAPLEERHKRYDEMQSWLFDCVYMNNRFVSPSLIEIWDECKKSEDSLRKQIHDAIDIQQIQNIQNSMNNIESILRKTDYYQMDNGSLYREQVDMMSSIARALNDIGYSFIRYMTPDASYPVYYHIDEITYKATDKLQSVEKRLSDYDEKFHDK